MMVKLKSFDLQVQGGKAAGYTIEAAGPSGERVPPQPFDWDSVVALSQDVAALQAGAAEPGTLKRVGQSLFQALFPIEVMMAYVAIKAQLGEKEGLRLRLDLPPEAARLPWELLYYPPHHLAVSPLSPVVRFLPLPNTPRPIAVRPPLRLVHLVASPVNAKKLDAEREAALLGSALADVAQVEILRARPGTLEGLRDRLREGCHILHFSGHGGMAGGEGYLLFEDEQGHGQRVSGTTLAHLLLDTGVRLAVLNACQSAAASASGTHGSVATALIRAGLPVVIAHQFPMSDKSAVAFASGFYRALADGYPVDGAAGEGRVAVLSRLGTRWQERLDWATPVLYMQAPDGQILTLEGDGQTDSQPAAPPSVHQQILVMDDATNIGTISGGTVHIDLGSAPEPATPDEGSEPGDPLPEILDELESTVWDYSPVAKRAQALEKVAVLKGAATDEVPSLDLLESVWQWFKVEVPPLSGPVLSAVLAFEDRVERVGGEIVQEFRQRFGGEW